MICISEKGTDLCCMCNATKSDVRRISFQDTKKVNYTAIRLCDRCLRHLREVLNILFEGGEHDV